MFRRPEEGERTPGGLGGGFLVGESGFWGVLEKNVFCIPFGGPRKKGNRSDLLRGRSSTIYSDCAQHCPNLRRKNKIGGRKPSG